MRQCHLTHNFGGCHDTVGRNLTLTPHFDHAHAERMWTQSWGLNALNDARSRFGFLLPDHQPQAWFMPMPPPNITGQLHLGHALFLTLQDIQTRYRALRGDDTLWLPGTDHAGLATHDKILQEMERLNLDPQDRAQYQRIGWSWKNHHHAIITRQMKRMGASCDWSKERFTLDQSYQDSAKEAFKRLWEQGLIEERDGQWWMSMETLAAPLLSALANGSLSITPQRSHHRLLNFLNNIGGKKDFSDPLEESMVEDGL